MRDVSMYVFGTFGLFYGNLVDIFYGHLVYFVVIWYIFSRLGTLYQETSGNPEPNNIQGPML
jgi:hypothetical protein